MAAQPDAVGTVQSGTGTSCSIPITIGAIANGVVLVYIALLADIVGLAATIGGETLTVVTGTDGASSPGAIFGKATSLTGSQTVSVSWTNSQGFLANAESFSGAHQTTPFNNGVNQQGAGGTALSVTSTSGDLTTTFALHLPVKPTTDQTEQWTIARSPTYFSTGDIGPGTGTTTHTWTGSIAAVYTAGCNIVQAAAATGWGPLLGLQNNRLVVAEP